MEQRERQKDDRVREVGRSYSFVGLLLAGVFRGFAGVAADLHVHGVDDVEEVLHHRHTLQGRIHPRDAVHALETDGKLSSSLCDFWSKVHRRQSDVQQRLTNRTKPSGNARAFILISKIDYIKQ